jgi:hypothetical protein
MSEYCLRNEVVFDIKFAFNILRIMEEFIRS